MENSKDNLSWKYPNSVILKMTKGNVKKMKVRNRPLAFNSFVSECRNINHNYLRYLYIFCNL